MSNSVNSNTITNINPQFGNQSTSSLTTSVEQMVTNIRQLQTTEMQLYSSLDNQNLSADQRTTIINQINGIGQTRSTLYNSLNNMASSYQQNVSNSENTLDKQIFALEIVENELNEAKLRQQELEIDKYNKLRLVEINTYYGKRFAAHKEIVKVIVYVCILMLIIIILGKKGILPKNIYILLNVIVIATGVVIIGKKLIDLSNRDNMNFDEYAWYFDSSQVPSDTSSSTDTSDPWEVPSVSCVGEVCCMSTPGLVYDNVQNVCVLNTNSSLDTSQSVLDPTTISTTSTTTTAPTTTAPTTESFSNNQYVRKNW